MGHRSKFPLLLHFAATPSYLHPLPASAPLSAPVTISQQRSLGALTSSDITQLSLSHPDSPPTHPLVPGSFLKAPISMSGSGERPLDSLLSDRYLNSSASKTCSVHNVTLYLSPISVAPFSLQDSILIECPPAMASAAVSMRLNAPPPRRWVGWQSASESAARGGWQPKKKKGRENKSMLLFWKKKDKTFD